LNPIALGLIGIGAMLLLFGVFSIVTSKKATEIILSLAGVIAIAAPFVISYFLTR